MAWHLYTHQHPVDATLAAWQAELTYLWQNYSVCSVCMAQQSTTAMQHVDGKAAAVARVTAAEDAWCSPMLQLHGEKYAFWQASQPTGRDAQDRG